MVQLDKITREAIAASVRKATMEALEAYNEKWLTGVELCKEFGFFSPEWLKRYGSTLPREAVGVTDKEGKSHKTGWCYPKHKIQRMILEGELRSLTLK